MNGSLIRLDPNGHEVERAFVAQRLGALRHLDSNRVLVTAKGMLRAITLATLPWHPPRR
ncbi:hypothetical protein [Actinokineospora diospyrosa]|uniref:hypothetical protein n=1 Tax=Actinokineospora diospyrosa TaxID=103728 RepID=UPI0020A32DDA|nr:hypothetical protein [Actinokineospora diospyrosa]